VGISEPTKIDLRYLLTPRCSGSEIALSVLSLYECWGVQNIQTETFTWEFAVIYRTRAVTLWGADSSWRMASSGMLRRVALVRTDVPEELSASFIRVTRIGELETTLAVTSNRRTLRRNTKWERKLEWNSELRMQRGAMSGKKGEIVAWGCKWPETKWGPKLW
jgi:hypothetical protein